MTDPDQETIAMHLYINSAAQSIASIPENTLAALRVAIMIGMRIATTYPAESARYVEDLPPPRPLEEARRIVVAATGSKC